MRPTAANWAGASASESTTEGQFPPNPNSRARGAGVRCRRRWRSPSPSTAQGDEALMGRNPRSCSLSSCLGRLLCSADVPAGCCVGVSTTHPNPRPILQASPYRVICDILDRTFFPVRYVTTIANFHLAEAGAGRPRHSRRDAGATVESIFGVTGHYFGRPRSCGSGVLVGCGGGILPPQSGFLFGIQRIAFFDCVANVSHRRRDHIGAAGPFSQIDQAAALAAKRELGAVPLYRLLAGGATQKEGTLASHRHIVDSRFRIADVISAAGFSDRTDRLGRPSPGHQAQGQGAKHGHCSSVYVAGRRKTPPTKTSANTVQMKYAANP